MNPQSKTYCRVPSLAFIVATVALCSLFSPTVATAQIAAWNFFGDNGATNVTRAATTFNSNLDSTNLLTRGAGAAASSGTNSFRTTGFQNNGIAVANTDYFQFALSAAAGFALNVTSISANLAGTASFSAAPGASNQFAYSLDGVNFTLIGAPSVRTGDGGIGPIDTASISALQNVASGTTVTFRFFASGQTATGGWGFSSPNASTAGLSVSGSLVVDNPNAPQISDFSPQAGVAGTAVTIFGTNFTGATSVTFGTNTAVAAFTVGSATNIQATVPSGAITGVITVATPNGTNTSAQTFLILDGSGTATVQNGTAPYAGKNIFPRNTSGQTLQVVYTPPASGTIEGLRIEVPAAFGAPLVGNVSVSGGGGSPSPSVSGQFVTVTGLAATSASNVTVSISGLTMPDTSTPITTTGANLVNVQSRGSGGTFAAIASSPSALVTVPLANVRNYDANFSPVLSNTVVAVQGTANVGKLANRGINASIQDSDWGVVFDASSAVAVSNLVRGNNYAAIGRVTQFQGVVQVTLTNVADLLDLGAGVNPAAVVATVSQFTNTNTAPTFQSRVVRIDNLNKLSGTWAVSNNVILTNSSGEQITVFIPFGSTATTEPVYPVNVTGIGGQSNAAAPFTGGWRIQPRDPADLTSATLPSIGVNPTSLTNLTATQDNFGPSTNFVVNASNLSNNITVTANDAVNFAISTNNTDFTSTLSLPTNSSGAVTNASVFVRLTGAAPDGAKSNTVTLASDATVTNVIVTGTVSPPPTPTLVAAPTNVLPLQAFQGSPSLAPYGTYALSGTAITNSVTISAPAGLQISYTNDGSGFGSSLTIPSPPPGGTFSTNVFVRVASNAVVGSFTNFITNSTIGGASNTLVEVTGQVDTAGTPTINPLNNTPLSGFTTVRPNASSNQFITLSGTNLTAPITVTPPPGWQISATNTNNYVTNPVVIATNPAGVVSNTTINIRLAGTNAGATNYPGSPLTLVSGSVSNNVLLSGTVNNPPPSLVLSTNTLTNFVTPTNTPSASTNFTVIGADLTNNVTVTPPTGWQVSATNTSNFTNVPITIGTNGVGAVNASVFLRIGSVAVPTEFTNSQVVVQSGTTSTNLIAVGSVTSAITAPTIANFTPTNGPRGTLVTINGAGFGSVSSNGVAFGGVATTNYTVVGSNQITAFVPLSAPTGRITVSNLVGVATSSINFTIDSLTLRVPPVIGGGVVTPARVSVPSPVSTDTQVILQSSRVPTIGIPSTVTIPAGQSYVIFPITTTTVGANVTGTISAFSANYIGTTASTTVSMNFTRAASFVEEGYEQGFAGFTNNRTLPFGWTNTFSDPRATQYAGFSPWGTTNVGIKYSVEGTNVFGVQHEPLLLTPGTNLQTLTLRNDTGTNVSQIRITYTGRTTSAFTNVDRFPAYTVTVAAAVNTNVVNFTTNVSDLNYSTGAGDNVVVTAKLALTNTAVANGIPAWTNFTVTWASTAGDGFDNSAQIGLGDLTVELVRPYVQLTPVAGVNDFITTAGTASVPRLFFASGQDLQGALVVTAPDNFEVSLSETGGYSASVSLSPVSGTVAPTLVYARIKASAPVAPPAPPVTVSGILSATSTNATTATQPISGVIFVSGGATQVLASPDALTNFTAIRPGASSLQSFFASGINLSNNITVSATTGFQVSTNTNSSSFATGVIIPRDAFSRVNPTPVYVRLAPNQSVGAKNGTATIASGATNDTVVLGGTVTAPPPLITISGVYSNFLTTRGQVSATQSNGIVSAANLLAPLILNATRGYEISTNGSTFAGRVSFDPTNGIVPTNRIWVRIAASARAEDPLLGNVNAQSVGAIPRSWSLTGTVTANTNPWIAALPSSLSGFITSTNSPSDPQTFTVEAANITENLRVNVTDKYEVSLTGDPDSYTNRISLPRAFTGGGGGVVVGTNASDNGANYASGWGTGSNGGTNFGVWTISTNNGTGGSAGTFIGDPSFAGITGMSANSFGLYANPAGSGASVQATRSLLAPLETNETLSFQWAVNFDTGSTNYKGFRILAGATQLLEVGQNGFPGDLRLIAGATTNTNLGIAYGTGPMTWSFSMTNATTLRVTSTARTNPNTVVFTTNLTVSASPDSFAWFAGAMANDADQDRRQPYFNNPQITALSSGAPGDVAPTTLFVRLRKQDGSPGPADGTVTASALPATPQTITLSGRVPSAPTINVSPSALTGFVTTAGSNSPAQSFTVDAQTLGGALNIAAPSGFEISLVSSNGFGSSLALTPTNESISSTPIFVRFAASATAGDYTNSLVQLSANGLLGQSATNTVQLSGTVFASNSTPQLALPVPPALSGFSTTAGTPSASQSYVIGGINLTSPMVVSAPAQFEVSSNNINFAPVVSNPVSSTALVRFTNYVRLAASATAGSPTGNVTNSSVGAANRLVLLTNNAVAATPSLSVAPSALSNFQSIAGFPSSPAQSFELRGTNIASAGSGFAPVTITASGPFEVSLNNTDWATTTNTVPAATSFTNTIYVRASSNATAGSITGAVNFSGQGITNVGPITVPAVALSGSTLPRPLITVSPTSLGPFESVSGFQPSASRSFTVSGTNLLTNITVAAPVSYEISTNNGASWTNLIALIPKYSDTNSFGPPVVVAQDNAGNYGNQTTYNAFNDFYVNVPATGGAGDYNRNTWIANAGTVPFNTGLTNPNTWSYAGGNFNGVGAPSSVGTYVSGGNFYPLTSGGTFAGPGASYALTNTNFWIGYNDQYGVATPGQTQIGKYTREWFSGSPNWLSNSNGTNNKFLWLQGTGLSASTDGLGAMLTWTAPNAGTFQFSGSYVNGNYGNPTSFAIVDSLNNTLLAKQTLTPSSASNVFGFTRTYSAGDVVQFQAGTPAAAQGSPLGLAVTISSGQPAWQTGANGGTGFGPWTIAVSNNPPTYFAGAFVGNPNAAGVTGMGTNAFGLYANPDGTPAFASAGRALGTPLQVGQTFSLQWGINWDSGAGNKGFSIFAGTNEIAKVNQGGFPGDVTFNGVTAVSGTTGFGTFPMTWTFSRTNTNSLLVTSTGRTNGTNIVFSTNVTITNAPDSFTFFTSAMQAGDQRQAYFNNLQITTPAGGSGGVVSNTTVLVRLKANAVSGIANQTIDVTSPIYAEPTQVTLNGQVFGQALTVNTNSLTGFATTRGVASVAQQFTVSGSNLVTDVTVAAPANYEISATSASAGFAGTLTLPVPSGSLGGNITNVPVWVRISAQATNTTASGTVNLTSALASASVTVNGAITNPQQPALNENYINFIYQRLLYRNPTTAERADYLDLLGGAGNIGNTTNKTKMITELMGFDPTRNLFNWQIVFDNVDGSAVPVPANYVISSLAFAPFARLGLTPAAPIVEDFIATSRTPTALAQTNIPLRTYAPSPMFNFNNAVAPYDTKDSVALAFADLLALPQFAAPREQFETTSTSAVPYISWLNSAWFWGKNTPSGFEGGSQAMIDMYRAYPAPYSRGLMAAFRSMYQWVVLAQSPSNVSNGSSLEGPFQLRANFAALDFQLWRNWGYSATSTAYSVDNVRNLLLRFPQITSGNLPTFAADQAFPGYEITASNAATPEAGLPEGLYYSALNLPAGLAVNPSTGAIFQTGAVPSGTYNNIIVQAQNFVGIGQKTVSLTVQPPTLGPATGWMAEKGLPGANFAAVANNDDDRDGLSNTQEYAFGLDPLRSDAGAFSAVINGSSLLVSWKGLKSGATYELQRSGNLSSWTNTDTSTLAPIVLDARYQLWQTNVSLPGGTESLYYRIKATFQPGALD